MLIFSLIILLFPFLGFIVLGLGFRKLPVKLTSFIAPGTIFISFLFSLIVTWKVIHSEGPWDLHLFDWISVQNFSLSVNFLIDPLTCVMMLIITGVGFLIHLYSIGYMKEDKGYNRFFAYMNLFVFSMLLLVLAGNYPIMFIGWEGVGLCSYLLIGFWFRNHQYNDAARKAFIMNRIGDLGFLIGMFFLFKTFQSLDFSTIFSQAKSFPSGERVIVLITILLLIGAVGKSAQIPLYTWLPDAMAGPTPVSALIHAATMVTAGIYMVARSGILYALSPPTMTLIVVTGILTAILSAVIALYQTDIKKILAYSTISQLGYMFIALAVGAFTSAIFHLTTHAFFKALLFLAAGSVIHALHGEQDIRKMGGMKSKIPRTWLVFLTGTLTIAGIPPLSGFFSKDQILIAVFERNIFLWVCTILGVVLTTAYIFRLFFMVFSAEFRGSKESFSRIKESGITMILPMFILAFLSFAGGLINLPGTSEISFTLGNFLQPVFADAMSILNKQQSPVNHLNEMFLAGLTSIVTLSVIWIVYSRNRNKKEYITGQTVPLNFLVKWCQNKFYVDELYDFIIVKPLTRLSDLLFRWVETGIVDKTVNGIAKGFLWLGNITRLLQTGHIGFYLFGMVFGLLLILLFFIVL